MNEDDKNLAVKFFKKEVKNNFKSKETGKPVFDRQDFISIIIPGNRAETRERKVVESDKERFAPIWEKYLKNEEIRQDGIMLEMLPGLDEARTALCKDLNIITIEQLAALNETGITNLGYGARDLVAQAKKYLEGTGAVPKLEQELREVKEENEQLKDSAEKLQAKIGELTDAKDWLEVEKKALETKLEKLKEKNDESTDNSTERSGRNTAVGKANNGSGKQRFFRKASSVAS